jgi:hypothetical protein
MANTNATPLQYPLINGYRWDYSAITYAAGGVPLPGVVGVDYAEELKKGEIYANGSPQKIGETLGQLKPTLSFDILAEEYENFIIALCALNGTPGSGYKTVRWDLGIAKQDGSGLTPGPLYKDLCRGVSINKDSSSFKVPGLEGLVQKVECSFFYLYRNGQLALTVNPANTLMTEG